MPLTPRDEVMPLRAGDTLFYNTEDGYLSCQRSIEGPEGKSIERVMWFTGASHMSSDRSRTALFDDKLMMPNLSDRQLLQIINLIGQVCGLRYQRRVGSFQPYIIAFHFF